MSQVTQADNSSTDFDLLSLHVLYDEILAVLKDAELHLCQFYDDKKQLELLPDSVNNLRQLASVFHLIAFDGADLLASALSDSYDKLYQLAKTDTTIDEVLMTDMSEAVMLLDRYVEFVLLTSVPEPSLLLAIINKIYAHLGKEPLDTQALREHNQSTVIHNLNANYASARRLGLDVKSLSDAYRAGLEVVLSYQAGDVLSDTDTQKLNNMTKACSFIAEKSGSLFWQSATILTQNIANELPVNYNKQRILVYLEQQFFDYLPASDRRFAQMVSIAYTKDHIFAKTALQKYQLEVSGENLQKMQRFLLGPNHEMTHAVHLLIQAQIEDIKQDVDILVRGEAGSLGKQVSSADISDELLNLSRTLYLLELNDASSSVLAAANWVNNWQSPTLEELDVLLDKLMVAENAVIELAKAHTLGTVKLPLHNHNISLYRLDMAYHALIKEAKTNLATTMTALDDYMADEHRDVLSLKNTPEMIYQVAGAASFLRMPITASQLGRLAKQLQAGLLQKIHDTGEGEPLGKMVGAWADVLICAEMAFDNFANNRPVDRQGLLVAEHSLNELSVDG